MQATEQMNWLAVFLASAGITTAREANFGKHYDHIVQAVRAANPQGLAVLEDLIVKTKRAKPQSDKKVDRTFEFQHIEGDKECLCALCRGDEGMILLGMYKHFGVEIIFREDSVTITA